MEEQATYETGNDMKMKMDETVIEMFIDKAGIKQAELKQFIRHVMAHFLDDVEQMTLYNQGARVAEKTRKILLEEGIDEEMTDAIATAALLARTNKKNEAYPNSHVIEFPMFLKKHGLEEGVNPGILNGMYRIVRSSLKAKTPIAEFVPKQGSPEYLVALLYRLEDM